MEFEKACGSPTKPFSTAPSIGPNGGTSLSAPLLCTRCGYQNQPGYQFCTNCGAPLGTAPPTPGAAPPPAYAPVPAYPSPGYYPSPMDYERTRHIDRTKTGVLLLMIGAVLGWIPFGISFIGAILSFIGAILVILGRRAFGAKHSRNVIAAVILYVLSIAALIGAGIVFAFATIASVMGSVPTAAQLTGAINALLIGGVVVAVIAGIAQVLFTYEIQNQTGRYLLFLGFGASVVLQIAVVLLISPVISSAIAQALAGGTYNPGPINKLQSQINDYALLAVIADLIWAAADYMVWPRINRGEIPAPVAAAAPMAPAPYPGMPPRTPPTPPQAPPPSGPAPPLNPR